MVRSFPVYVQTWSEWEIIICVSLHVYNRDIKPDNIAIETSKVLPVELIETCSQTCSENIFLYICWCWLFAILILLFYLITLTAVVYIYYPWVCVYLYFIWCVLRRQLDDGMDDGSIAIFNHSLSLCITAAVLHSSGLSSLLTYLLPLRKTPFRVRILDFGSAVDLESTDSMYAPPGPSRHEETVRAVITTLLFSSLLFSIQLC